LAGLELELRHGVGVAIFEFKGANLMPIGLVRSRR
jgi:hypothetical protein